MVFALNTPSSASSLALCAFAVLSARLFFSRKSKSTKGKQLSPSSKLGLSRLFYLTLSHARFLACHRPFRLVAQSTDPQSSLHILTHPLPAHPFNLPTATWKSASARSMKVDSGGTKENFTRGEEINPQKTVHVWVPVSLRPDTTSISLKKKKYAPCYVTSQQKPGESAAFVSCTTHIASRLWMDRSSTWNKPPVQTVRTWNTRQSKR